jgi:trans-2-enoyl-CoA reductase
MEEKSNYYISDETKNWSISNLKMFIEKLYKEKEELMSPSLTLGADEEELDKNIALYERELYARQQKEYFRQMKSFSNNSIARNWL